MTYTERKFRNKTKRQKKSTTETIKSINTDIGEVHVGDIVQHYDSTEKYRVTKIGRNHQISLRIIGEDVFGEPGKGRKWTVPIDYFEDKFVTGRNMADRE